MPPRKSHWAADRDKDVDDATTSIDNLISSEKEHVEEECREPSGPLNKGGGISARSVGVDHRGADEPASHGGCPRRRAAVTARPPEASPPAFCGGSGLLEPPRIARCWLPAGESATHRSGVLRIRKGGPMVAGSLHSPDSDLLEVLQTTSTAHSAPATRRTDQRWDLRTQLARRGP